MARLDKATRDAKLDDAIVRLKAIHDRNAKALAALPAKAGRTNAQKTAARDAKDWMLVVRAVLLIAGSAAATDIDDGTGVE